ncbi:MAG: hypothetical protein JNM78_03885 [Cyclobacteriaceae bacterium]|nr:hypothetical protein [Cyclobacteriaceae bacterium]
MKVLRILSLISITAVLLTYAGCKGKGGDPEPIADVQFDKLKKTWKINTVANSVTLDGVDKTGDYPGFQITFSGTKGTPPFDYATSGRPSLSPWKASGKWDFGTAVETQMIRDKGTADELAMTYSVTESTLTISFNFTGTGYSGRTGVVSGDWVFKFTL